MPRSKPIRIFVSSPGDVIYERGIACAVIKRLDRELSSRFHVEGVFWEQEPLLATEHFQKGIPAPSRTDIVVVILWSRLGHPMPRSDFPGPVTGRRVTGTEYEWEEALSGWKKRGWPSVLFYRKVADAPVKVADPVKRRAVNEQLDKVDDFIQRWFFDAAGSYKNAYREFTTPVELSELLYGQLLKLLKRHAASPARRPRESPPAIRWHQGSPFRGLLGFSFEHSEIFFGRTRARNELRQALLRQMGAGSAFLTVVGASGSGKSSLVKAGLLPDITTPGLVEGVGLCRYAVLRPSDRPNDLPGTLAEALLAPSALPELREAGHDARSLKALLRTAQPDALLASIRGALRSAAHARGLLPGAAARLAIVVDQLEELLTQSLAPSEREEFIQVLELLARSGDVWVIATLRSDFLGRCADVPRLAALTSGSASWVLYPPSDEEIGQIIRLPAEAAGLDFEVEPSTGQHLDEALRQEAAASPSSLPLLQYLLEQLWNRRTASGMLTFAAYKKLGGLSGVLGRRAEEVFRVLPKKVQEELPRTLRALVTVAPGEGTAPAARSAPLTAFPEGTPRHALVSAFLAPEARLLVADGERLRVAHESLLRHWTRAANLIEKDRADLQVRARIEQAWRTWSEAAQKDKDSLLLPAGLPLDEAEYLLQRRQEDLSAEVADYIQQSRRKHKAEVARLQWLRLRAEAASLRSQVEEGFARAQRNELLARRAETLVDWPGRGDYLASLRENGAQFRTAAQVLWKKAYERELALRSHPGAPSAEELRQAPPGAVLRLELLEAQDGLCVLLHHGSRRQPKLIMVDSGEPGAFKPHLKPRLRQLRAARRQLPIELVVITHAHHDRLGGLLRLLEELSQQKRSPVDIQRLWFNNVLPLGDKESLWLAGLRNATRLVLLTRKLGIPLNRPFDYFAMPSEMGPARVALEGGMTATVIGPSRRNMERLVRLATESRSSVPEMMFTLVDQLGGVLSEGFSSPEITLLRAPPGLPPEPRQPGWSEHDLNSTSLVTVFEQHGRRLLFPGDAHGNDILHGLHAAGYGLPGERIHLDVMVLPAFGSSQAMPDAFLHQVTADHYVVQGSRRFMMPDPELVHALARARAGEAFTLHVGLSADTEKLRRRLRKAIRAEAAKGWKGEVRFRSRPGCSLFIDLLTGTARQRREEPSVTHAFADAGLGTSHEFVIALREAGRGRKAAAVKHGFATSYFDIPPPKVYRDLL